MTRSVSTRSEAPKRGRLQWALPLLPVAISGFLLSAMTWLRLDGARPGADHNAIQRFIVATYDLFGFEPLFIVAMLVLAWSSIWFLTGEVERPLGRLARIVGLGLCLAVLVNLRADGSIPADGGELGATLASRMNGVFAPTLSLFVVACAALAALLLATDFFFYRYFDRLTRSRGRRDTAVEHDAVRAFEDLRLEVGEPAPTPTAGVVRRTADAPTVAAASATSARTDTGDVDAAEQRHRAVARRVAFEAAFDAAFDPSEPSAADDGGAPRSSSTSADVDDVPDVAAGDGVSVMAGGETNAPTQRGLFDAPDPDRDPDPCAAEPSAGASLCGQTAAAPETGLRDEDVGVSNVAATDAFSAESHDVADTRSVASADHDEDQRAFATIDIGDVHVDSFDADAAEPDVLAVGLTDHAVVDEGEVEFEPMPEGAESAPATVASEEVVVEPIYELPARAAEPVTRVSSDATAIPVRSPLYADARELVVEYRRASANFLRRRLRISIDDAMELLQQLAEDGVIACDVGASQGRVLVGPDESVSS